jgi:hypothetical protein
MRRPANHGRVIRTIGEGSGMNLNAIFFTVLVQGIPQITIGTDSAANNELIGMGV